MDKKRKSKKDEDLTDGINILTWQLKHYGTDITYSAWDFAGQTVYYNTHQVAQPFTNCYPNCIIGFAFKLFILIDEFSGGFSCHPNYFKVFMFLILQFFLSKKAIYVLVWNTRLGYEHAGLDFWLSSIRSHAPKTPIFIVGTFADQVCV